MNTNDIVLVVDDAMNGDDVQSVLEHLRASHPGVNVGSISQNEARATGALDNLLLDRLNPSDYDTLTFDPRTSTLVANGKAQRKSERKARLKEAQRRAFKGA